MGCALVMYVSVNCNYHTRSLVMPCHARCSKVDSALQQPVAEQRSAEMMRLLPVTANRFAAPRPACLD